MSWPTAVRGRLRTVARREAQEQFGEVWWSLERVRVVLCFACVLAWACRSDPTQIVVAVNTDYAIPSGLDEVRFDVSASGVDVAPVTKKLTAMDAHELPVTLALNGRGGQRIDVTVGGYRDGELRVRVRATARFVSERSLALPMNLLRACESRFEKCESLGLTCGSDQGCMSVEHSVLDGWDGPPSFDPPPFDASSPADAGPTTRDDAGAGSTKPATIEDPVVKLALGKEHSCALRQSGKLACWGSDDSGQLGTGGVCALTSAACAYPRVIEGLDAVDVSAGDDFTCAVSRDGHVWCWGPNDKGQLGAGPLPQGQLAGYQNTPALVPGITGATGVELGGTSACAWGTRYGCWGGNKAGQLRVDLGSPLFTPTRPDVALAADHLWLGSENGCGPFEGALSCTGNADYGVVVDTANDGSNLVFVGGVTDADVGAQHACAVQQHKLWCWGLNDQGQLGDPLAHGSCTIGIQEVPCSRGPVEVEDRWGLAEPALGEAFSCAVVRAGAMSGQVACWGDNTSAIVDSETTAKIIAEPKLVNGISRVRLLAAGGRHACVVTEDDRVWCWGSNEKGQIGPNVVYGQLLSWPVEVVLD